MAPSGSIAQWRTYRRIGVFVRPYAWRLAAVLVISLAATSLSLVQPYISKLLIDRALLRRDMQALSFIAALMFAAVVIGFGLNMLSSYRYVRISAAMLFDMRLALFRHLQSLSPRFYARFRLGDLMSRLNNDIGEVQRVCADTLLSVVSNIVFLAGSVAMMLWLNWRLFLVSIILIPGCLFTFIRFQRRLTLLTKSLRERSADLGSLFVDSILGMRVIKALTAEEYERGRFRERNDAYIRTMLQVQIASFLSGVLPGTILSAATASVFLYGGWLIFSNQMTIGTLVAFLAYHTRLLSPVQSLMSLSSGLASARVSLARIFELFDTPAEIEEAATPLMLPDAPHAICFQAVSIRHDRAPILEQVSLTIPAGSFCAILGPSGAGKSTLADLMVRYLDPDQGRILIDGIDLRQLSLNSLRREVLLLDQTPHLFSVTIAENIAYARPEATLEEIQAAGSGAGLDELIERLPQGYQTPTGERGLALSVGERQRIALARALLRRPNVLILDEPTSALDQEVETLIAENLRTEMKGKTLIVITHRPALAALADAVVTLQNGTARMALAHVSG